MSGKLKTILSLAVGALFVYLFVHNLNLGDVWNKVRAANRMQLGLALALLVGTYFVRVLRWRAASQAHGSTAVESPVSSYDDWIFGALPDGPSG